MQVLHLTDGLTADGAEIAVGRLHAGLRRAGVDSRVLCLRRASPHVESVLKFKPANSGIERKIDSLLKRFSLGVGLDGFFDLSSFKITDEPPCLESDVLVIHGYYSFSPLAIPQLTRNKTALLVLHDMWSFTGHCGHSLDCERWTLGCGKCPYPATPPAIRRDSTRLGWTLKDWAYRHSHLAVVSPSSWMADLAAKSMLGRFAIHHVPHGVDTGTFRPLEREHCRTLLGIPPAKKVVMFVAPHLTDHLKGGDLLRRAMESLPARLKDGVVLVLMGSNGDAIASSVAMESVNLGYVSNDRVKAIAYSSADVLVHPSRAETFSYVILESMACGTPIVAFRVGGIPELVRPGTTGYLAAPGDAEDLCNGVVELLEDKTLRDSMSHECREIAVREFPIDLQVERYIALFRHKA